MIATPETLVYFQGMVIYRHNRDRICPNRILPYTIYDYPVDIGHSDTKVDVENKGHVRICDFGDTTCANWNMQIDYDMLHQMYFVHKHRWPLYDKIMMTKSSLGLPGYTSRPSFNIIMNEADQDRIENELGYKFLIIGELENIEQIICTVFSWGTINWCNRMWAHPDAQVMLLSPKCYDLEYTVIPAELWQLNVCRRFRVCF